MVFVVIFWKETKVIMRRLDIGLIDSAWPHRPLWPGRTCMHFTRNLIKSGFHGRYGIGIFQFFSEDYRTVRIEYR